MSLKEITSKRYKCKCKAVNKDGTLCGHKWESDHIPKRCAKCKKPTWNRAPIRHGQNGKMIKAFGKSQSIAAWGRESGISKETLSYRLKSGWKIEDALRTPVRVWKKS